MSGKDKQPKPAVQDANSSAKVDEEPKQADWRIQRPDKRGMLSFRNIAVISILAVGAALGYEYLRNPEFAGESKVGGTPNLDATPAGEQLRTSERYQENLRQQNELGAEEAQNTGESFIATPDEPLRDIDQPAVVEQSNPNRPLPPANPTRQEPAPEPVIIERPIAPQPHRQAQATAPGPDFAHINQLAQMMRTQQQGLAQSWQAQPSAVTVVVEQDLVPTAKDEVAGNAGSPALRASNQFTSTGPDILVRAGDVYLASASLTNDSDTPGPVIVELRRGPLQGARLIGGFQANQNNTHLIAQFNTAILPDGTELPISAYAVDARQRSLAVRSDYDRRILARYAPRVAAAFVSGLGAALSDPGSTVVDIGGIGGITRPAPTFEQGLYSGLAEVGNDLAGEFVRSAPKGPLISLRHRQVIGVLFTANVHRPAR